MKKSSNPSRKAATEIAAQASQIERDLAVIRRAMRQPLDAEVGNANITAPQKAVMQVIVQSPGVSLKDLSRAVSLAHSTVSGIVDRLEQRGIVERQPDDADRRISRIYPSQAVVRFVKDTIPALESGPLLACLPSASAEDRAKIAWAVQRLRQLLEAQ